MSAFRQGFDSICIKDDHSVDGIAHTPPIYASSTFIYESPEKAMSVFRGEQEAYIYGRWGHPNADLAEKKIAALECFDTGQQASACLFSSGMAAISAVFSSVLKPGDAVIAQGNIYGTTVELLDNLIQRNGIRVLYADLHDLNSLKTLARNTNQLKLIYAETPSNPTISCYDLSAISNIAHDQNTLLAVDNTFATPYLQQPFRFGVDIIVHSTTKFLNGHGTAIGGIVISRDKNFMKEGIWKTRKLMGAIVSPFDAWLLNNGLKTLSLRMERHSDNAKAVADFLASHPAVSKVNYLGHASHPDHALSKVQMRTAGGVLSFELQGGIEAGISLMQKIKFCTLTASVGTTDTLIQHPASMTHFNMPKEQRLQYGITDGLIRLSVGIENAEDIIEDLRQGLL